MKRYLYILIFVWLSKSSSAACPLVYDYLGNLSSQPYWISCTGGAYNLNFQSNTSWGAYTINWGDGTPSFAGGAYVGSTIIAHTYTATIDTFIVTLSIPGSTCVMTGIVVMEKPVNASIQIPIGGVTTACAPNALLFTNSSTDVSKTTIFTWSFGDGTPTSTFSYTNAGQTLSHTYLKGTVTCTTTVTLTAKNYCTPAPTVANFTPIQIYDIDIAAITPSAFIKCWPDNVFTFNNTTNRNCVPQGNTFQRQEKWNFGNYWGLGHDSIVGWRPWPPTSPYTIAYPSVGSYSVQLIDSNLCGVDTQIIFVSIVNPPSALIIAPVGPLCQGAAVTFTNASTLGVLYKWNFGDGGGFVFKPFGIQTHTYTTAGTYTISLVALIGGAGSSCSDTDKVVITILPKPTALFSVIPNKGCDKITGAMFTDLSSSAVAWSWNFGNGNTFVGLLPPAQNYTAVGNYVATLTVTGANTCVHSYTAPVNVYPKPIAAFSPTSACVASATNFFDNTPFSIGDPIVSWNWNFGDASPTATSSVQNPLHTYTLQNTYTVQLIVNTANCGDTVLQTITINIKPTANFTLTPISGCPTLTVNFTNTSLNATSYNWTFGNLSTSTSTNTSSVYTNTLSVNKNYTVTLIAGTALGCTDTKTAVVTVFPKPTVSFTTNAIAGCSPIVATFTNNSVGSSSYNWTFGDGATSTSTASALSHTYTNLTLLIQTYTVQLVAISINGCKDSMQLTVTAYPHPIFNFTMAPNSGCSPLNINFSPVLGAVTYQWDFGDGITDNTINAAHTYTNLSSTSNQTYTCMLVAISSNGCRDSITKSVLLLFKPKANFTVDTPSCSPKILTFTNTSTGSLSYNWDFGTSSSTNINESHQYINNTAVIVTNTVQLIATSVNNCKDTLIVFINIYPKPEFTIIANPDSGCTALKVLFPNIVGVSAYQWNFGDGTSSMVGNTSNTFYNNSTADKTFTVQLIATNNYGCKDTSTKVIKVFAKPVALFQANPTTVFIPTNPVNCTNLSTGAISYFWNFGDFTNSTLVNPSHLYLNAGFYQITLIATNVHGCKDTFELPSKITALLESDIEIPNAFSPNPNGSNGGAFGVNDLNNDVFHPVLKGIEKYELNIFSRWGELLFVSKDVNIGWDGYYKGKLCTSDVYVWKIIATTIDGKKINKAGDVFLLR